jgi:ATP-dependent DNA ligase
LELEKTFKGLTDVEIIDLTKRLKESAVSEDGHRVVVIPKIVVEVATTKSSKAQDTKAKWRCASPESPA